MAKGLCRGDVLYAMEMLNSCVRPELKRQLLWLAGEMTGWRQSMGKCGDKLQRVLPANKWQALLSTYVPAEKDTLWQTLFSLGEQFSAVALEVAEKLGFSYPVEQAARVVAYARAMREDAKR